VQINIGFGDTVTPGTENVQYPWRAGANWSRIVGADSKLSHRAD